MVALATVFSNLPGWHGDSGDPISLTCSNGAIIMAKKKIIMAKKNMMLLYPQLPSWVQRDIQLVTDSSLPKCLLFNLEDVIRLMEEVPAAFADSLQILKRVSNSPRGVSRTRPA
jgi:hypothetical protein